MRRSGPSGDVVDLADRQPAQQPVLRWHNLPIFVVRRTAAMLDALQDNTLVARLVDARSEKRQQPPYAANWHRSIDPAVSVLVGVCTYCAFVPQFVTEAFPPDVTGGYVSSCCASHFDPAGRAHMGPAQDNLPVPPYDLFKRSRLVIGRNASERALHAAIDRTHVSRRDPMGELAPIAARSPASMHPEQPRQEQR